MRVEGLLAAFPKLAFGNNNNEKSSSSSSPSSSSSSTKSQHTYVETDTVRYVYQPLENGLYLLLITTRTSNIVEDLGTLRLMAKVVPDVAGSVAESAINDAAFEIIFAFDEVLIAGGYREDMISLSWVCTNLEMEIHEEAMHIILQESMIRRRRTQNNHTITPLFSVCVLCYICRHWPRPRPRTC